MFPILQIGPLAIQFPGLLLLAGLWLGLEIMERQAPRLGLPGGKLYNLALITLGAGIVGGRLIFAAQNPLFFNDNPLNLLSLSPALFSLPGAAIAGITAGLAFGRRNHLPFWNTLDALSAGFAVLLITISLANFASGDAYGAAASLPWSVNLGGALRHPAQVYEALAYGVVLFTIWPARWNRLFAWTLKRPGARFLVFLAGSSLARLFLEVFRGDSTAVWGNFRQAQLIAWFILAASLWGLNRRFNLPMESAAVIPSAGDDNSGDLQSPA